MEVAALHYGVQWLAERHPMSWADGVLPTDVTVPGWNLEVCETRLSARPRGRRFRDEGLARADLEPHLHGWAAHAEVVEHLRMEMVFLDAEMKRIAPVSLSGRGSLEAGSADFAVAVENVAVQVIQERIPELGWSGDSAVAREVREYCLRPMRAGRRLETDAAYWLVTRLEDWAGDLPEAARKLQMSRALFVRARSLSGRATQRKVEKGSRLLSEEEISFLHRFIEVAAFRLHQVECGLDPGMMLNIGDLKRDS